MLECTNGKTGKMIESIDIKIIEIKNATTIILIKILSIDICPDCRYKQIYSKKKHNKFQLKL